MFIDLPFDIIKYQIFSDKYGLKLKDLYNFCFLNKKSYLKYIKLHHEFFFETRIFEIIECLKLLKLNDIFEKHIKHLKVKTCDDSTLLLIKKLINLKSLFIEKHIDNKILVKNSLHLNLSSLTF